MVLVEYVKMSQHNSVTSTSAATEGIGYFMCSPCITGLLMRLSGFCYMIQYSVLRKKRHWNDLV